MKLTSDVHRPLPPVDPAPETKESPIAATRRCLFMLLAIGAIAGCATGGGTVLSSHSTSSATARRDGQNISRALPGTTPTPVPASQAGCNGGPGNASCNVQKGPGAPNASAPVGGLTPAQLRAAYGLPAVTAVATAAPAGPPAAPVTSTSTASGALVAVVVAFDSPAAASDLAVYRSQYGLPACTAQSGCFQKVIVPPTPGDPPPAPSPPGSSSQTTWDDERALDLAMVSAACPGCRIMLVEAAGQDLDSLAHAVAVAASYHPVAISNSWGVPEGGGNVPNIDATAQAAFVQPGIAITADAGDLGAGQVQFPASSASVTAVGGTTLTQSSSSARGWTEAEWSGSGDGCSIMIGAPSWQSSNACNGMRSVPDVSFVANPATGVAVFDSADNGWEVLGGTSVGAPFIAGLYGAAANFAATLTGPSMLYANIASLNSVPGFNGSPNGLTGL